MESLVLRKSRFQDWLTQDCGLLSFTLDALPGDASTRRYYRVHSLNKTFIAMDAPYPENCTAFVAISRTLHHLGLQVPVVHVANIEHGFLLLTDFGDATYLKILNNDNADPLYQQALSALATLQSGREVLGHDLPHFSENFMWREWQWHKEWFLEKWLGASLSQADSQSLENAYQQVVTMAATQPQVFMHRDYHSANLMRIPVSGAVGILDFQDAHIGPVTYDVVSLLRDCYIAWPAQQVHRWLNDYYFMLRDKKVMEASFDEFVHWFDWMGVERHLKALMTFARKHVRDQQPSYLKHVPRTLQYLSDTCHAYPTLQPLANYLDNLVYPHLEKEIALCVQ